MIKTVDLDSIAEIVRGVTFSKADGSLKPEDGRLPVIRAGSIQSTLLVNEGQIWVPEGKVKSHQIIRKNDIIMCTSSGSASLVGKCAIANEDWIGSFGAFCAGIRADEKKCIPSYLYYFLSSPTFRNWSGASDGANIKNIRASDLAKFPIPLPPLETQKKIAAVLEKADQLRKDCQKMEQELNSLAQAVFIDMFGDPVTNPKGWDIKPISSLLSQPLQNGAYYPKEDYSDVGVEMVHMGDVFYDFIPRGGMKRVNASQEDIEKYKLNSNDLLISRRSLMLEGAAKPSLIEESKEDLIFESSMIRLTPNNKIINVVYLFYYLNNPIVKQNYIYQYITGATIKGINQSNLSKVEVLVPDYKLQESFLRIEQKIRNQKNELSNLATEYEANFNALMQKAFKGELNL